MTRVLLAFAALLLLPISDAVAQPAKPVKVTVLSTMLAGTDGIGEWGFAAVPEVDGRRLLVDTGARAETVTRNAEELKVDLSTITDLVITHNHGEHIALSSADAWRRYTGGVRAHEWIDRRSLALHGAVAAKLEAQPELLELARANLQRWLPLNPADADVFARYAPDKSDLIDGAIGELSMFHETYGYYAHGIDDTTALMQEKMVAPSVLHERLQTSHCPPIGSRWCTRGCWRRSRLLQGDKPY